MQAVNSRGRCRSLPLRMYKPAVSVNVVTYPQAPLARCVHNRTRFPSSWPFPQTSSDPSAPTATQTRRVYHHYPLPDAHIYSAVRFADRWLNRSVLYFHFTLNLLSVSVLYVMKAVFYDCGSQPCDIQAHWCRSFYSYQILQRLILLIKVKT